MHGRSSLMESLVWLIPFLCVKRREKKKRQKKREYERENEETKSREIEMKRGEQIQKHVSGPSKPPDELAQNVSKKKNPRRTNYSFFFFFESSESDRVFNYKHDSNSIFRAGRINSEWVRARTVRRLGIEEQTLPRKSNNILPRN